MSPSNAAASNPAPLWRVAGEREHFVQFYEDDAVIVEAVNGFIRHALDGGAAGVVIATTAHLADLEHKWSAAGFDVAAARANGQLVTLDASETLSRFIGENGPDAGSFVAAIEPIIATMTRRFPRVVAFGEMVGLLWEAGRHGDAVRLEEFWNDLAERHAFALFCAYRLTGSADSASSMLQQVCASHARAIPAESFTKLATSGEQLAEICELQLKAKRLEQEIKARNTIERSMHDAYAMRSLLAAIVESSDDAIVSKTLDGRITSWNKGAEALFGYTPDEIIGKSVTTIIPPELRHEEPAIVAKLMRGERIDHYETTRLTKSGARISVSLTVSPVKDASGTVIGASKVVRDVTDRMRMEAQLREAAQRKDEFLAMLGHELRNPLAPIRNVSEVLRRMAGANAAQEEMCRILDRQVQYMTRLLDDLLDVSRITQGKIQFVREPVDMLAVVARAVETSRPLIDAQRHDLTISLPERSLRVTGDLTRLVQAVGNLLNNAAKYTPEGGRLKISVESDDLVVVLRVRDSGVGISTELLPHVFEMFVQADRTLERSQGGLGIGLTLVRSIVEQHDGEIEAVSAGAGKGSEFIVRLPLLDEAATDRGIRRLSPLPARHQKSKRIVIVDDNRDGAESMSLLLRLSGHETVVTGDGPSALTHVASFRPDLVLLDIGLPEMNGYEVARRLRENGYSGTIAALTGYGHADDLERSRAAGFDHHFTKPVDPTVIASLLS